MLASGCYQGLEGAAEDGASSPNASSGVDAGDDADMDGDDDGDASDGENDEEPPIDIVPAPGGLRWLTSEQYVATVRELLGTEAATEAAPPGDQPQAGFAAIGAGSLPLSPQAIEQYERSAIFIGKAVVQNPERLGETVECVVEGPQDDACYAAIARDFGRLAWRRPLTDAEIETGVEVAQEARALFEDDFDRGMQYELVWLLTAPDFLYVVEVGEPGDTDDAPRKLSPDEIATRLSLFILGHTPQPSLFRRASEGDLDDEAGVRKVAGELVAHSHARVGIASFWDEYTGMRTLPAFAKDGVLFPSYTSELAGSMRQEALHLVEHIVFEEGASILRLFDADYTFVDARLAAFYGVEAPAYGFEMRTVPADQGRLGLLTLPGVLSLHSLPNRNSPTRRGVFVQRQILCNEVPPPPGDIDTTLPELEEPTTLRSLIEQHMDQGEICSGCHAQTDPVGFAFEHFDATGARRELDNGYAIDASGEVEDLGSWQDATELALRVLDDPRVPACMTRNVYRYSIGAVESADLGDALATVTDGFVAADHDFQQLLVELAASPALRWVGAPK
jgi:hypothetical protein